ncbi:MAG: hypothetical protein QXO40_05320 [Candidatus Aenigmatarchaeota archaeon]
MAIEADEEVKIEYWKNQKIIIDNCEKCKKFLFCYPTGAYFELKKVEKACKRKEVLKAMKRINEIYSKYESSSLGLTEEIAKKVGLNLSSV